MTGVAAGVPYVALPPAEGAQNAGLVAAWHLVDPPRTEAMAAALPLAGVPAWRVYFGLPMLGTRMPAGGFDEVMRLMQDDIVLNFLGPIIEQAAAEAPAAIDGVREELGLDDEPIGLVGASAGSAVALLLAEGVVPVTAAALVSPVVQLPPVVEACGVPNYAWTPESRTLAKRLDFVARASEIAGRDPQPAARQWGRRPCGLPRAAPRPPRRPGGPLCRSRQAGRQDDPEDEARAGGSTRDRARPADGRREAGRRGRNRLVRPSSRAMSAGTRFGGAAMVLGSWRPSANSRLGTRRGPGSPPCRRARR